MTQPDVLLALSYGAACGTAPTIPEGWRLAPGWLAIPGVTRGRHKVGTCLVDSCLAVKPFLRNGEWIRDTDGFVVCRDHAVEMGALVRDEPPAAHDPACYSVRRPGYACDCKNWTAPAATGSTGESSRGCGASMPPWRCGELMPVGSIALCDRCAGELPGSWATLEQVGRAWSTGEGCLHGCGSEVAPPGWPNTRRWIRIRETGRRSRYFCSPACAERGSRK